MLDELKDTGTQDTQYKPQKPKENGVVHPFRKLQLPVRNTG